MKFHKQQFMHDPDKGIYGDCQRAAIASILGLEMSEVPHFGEGGPDAIEFFSRVEAFLEPRGLRFFSVAYNTKKDAILSMCLNFLDGVYMLTGSSNRGTNHVVIYRNSEMIFDPHPSNCGLSGPCSDGHWWIGVLVYQPNNSTKGDA